MTRFILLRRSLSRLKHIESVPDCITKPHSSLTTIHTAFRRHIDKPALRALRKTGTFIPGVLQRYHQPDLFLEVPVKPLVRDLVDNHRFVPTKAPNSAFSGPIYNLLVYETRDDAEKAAKGLVHEPTLSFHAAANQMRIHPLTESPVHVGFYAYDRTGVVHPRGVRLRLPIRIIGTEKCDALRFGYVNHITRAVDVYVEHHVIPPAYLVVDIETLSGGASRYGRDIPCPAGVSLVAGDEQLQIVKIVGTARAGET